MSEKLPNHSLTPDWYREILVVSDEPVAFAIGRFSLPPSVKMHQAAPKKLGAAFTLRPYTFRALESPGSSTSLPCAFLLMLISAASRQSSKANVRAIGMEKRPSAASCA